MNRPFVRLLGVVITAASVIFTVMGAMPLPDWSWGWENRFYSIGVICVQKEVCVFGVVVCVCVVVVIVVVVFVVGWRGYLYIVYAPSLQ